jgi:hypothetical protein
MTTPQERLELAVARDPLSSRFGALVRDADDVGLAMFCWYDTPQELRRSVLEDHAFPNDGDERDPKEWGRVRGELEALLAASPDLDTATRERLNVLTAPWFAFDWWGTFDELCTSDQEAAGEVRARFHEAQDVEDDSSPIAEAEREDFAAALGEMYA